MTGQTISRYLIGEKLGQGGMGVVYKAHDLKLKRPLALKFIPSHLLGNPDIRARFEREAQAAAAEPFLVTPFRESRPQVSPSGRYVAYCSNESGSYEVYVREFSSAAGLWQVSERGGCQPRWSHDGRELFYSETSTNTLVAVEVSEDPSFKIGRAERLFQDPSLSGTGRSYDVTADGRFVLVEPVEAEQAAQSKPAIHVIENRYEDFRDRAETP